MTPTNRQREIVARYLAAKFNSDARLSGEELDAIESVIGLLRTPAPADAREHARALLANLRLTFGTEPDPEADRAAAVWGDALRAARTNAGTVERLLVALAADAPTPGEQS